ncbi:hypothetical protein F2Q68_00025657 [Brassica cretica]|uniref:Uncharacterized protein n=1 Tax=Brassica cretica TaxID=69181 RepID=A0A8S9IHW2_BRACR|nr:hypothetical protein F2Q68_00025657 [Brassica cretica]
MSFGGSHWCRSMPYFEHRTMNDNPNRSTGSPEYRSITPTESTTSCNAVMILTHVEFAARHPHPPSPVYVKIDRHSDIPIDRHYETDIDRQPPAPIDRRAPLTYRVQMPKIDIALRKPQTSSRRINDPGIIAACHCGAEYETEYSASIETYTATSIDNAHQQSTDKPGEESVDISQDDWENDCYNPIMAVNDATPETRKDLYDEEYKRK